MAGEASRMVDATSRFRGFDETANDQMFEVSPTPSARLHSGNWNSFLRDASTDYPDSLDLGFQKNNEIDVRYEAPPSRYRNNFVGESWTFDWNGKIRLARRVQLAGGKASLFDLDDFAQATTKFCLHGLNTLLRTRPLPAELEFFISVSNLQGKMLQNDAILNVAPRAGAVCRTSGNVPRAFNISLASPPQAMDLLRDQLYVVLDGVVGAFQSYAPGSPLTVSAERFAEAYSNAQSRLTLRAIRAISGTTGSAAVA
jgi:hypothetical protein